MQSMGGTIAIVRTLMRLPRLAQSAASPTTTAVSMLETIPFVPRLPTNMLLLMVSLQVLHRVIRLHHRTKGLHA
jgi:hypothetical protein